MLPGVKYQLCILLTGRFCDSAQDLLTFYVKNFLVILKVSKRFWASDISCALLLAEVFYVSFDNGGLDLCWYFHFLRFHVYSI